MARKKKEEPSEEYFVEAILAARVIAVSDSEEAPKPKRRKKNAKSKSASESLAIVWLDIKEYKVKWYGYDKEEDNTWEPAENLDKSCSRLLKSFWDVIGHDEYDWPVGSELPAPEEWIAKERKRFAREHKKEEKKKTSAQAKTKEDDEDSQPKSTPPRKTDTKKKKSLVIESESDSDAPLARKPAKATGKGKRLKKATIVETPEPSPSVTAEDVPSNARGKKRKRPGEERPTVSQPQNSSPPIVDSPNSLFSEVDNQMSIDTNTDPVPPVPRPPQLPPLPVRQTVPPLPARPSLPSLPTRTKAQPNPHTKLASLPHEAESNNTGISTKQRLAQGALAPMLPRKQSGPSTKPKLSPVRTGSSTIMQTGFRKTSQIAASSTIHHEPTLASLNAGPSSPNMAATLPDIPMVQTPTEFEPPSHSFGGDSFRTSSLSNADDFLRSMMPPEMAAPLVPVEEASVDPRPPPPLPFKTKGPPLPTRTTKTFKWEGAITVGNATESDKSVTAFKVSIEEETDVKQTGLRFSMLLRSVSDLRVLELYNLSDLPCIIPACQSPSQFAKMALQDTEDSKAWNTFLRYLGRSNKVILIPLHLDGNVVAHLLLSHHKLPLPSSIRPPVTLKTPGALIATIMPWSLSQEQIAEESRLSYSKASSAKTAFEEYFDQNEASEIQRQEFEKSMKTRPLFHEAIRVLRLSPKIYDYLKLTNRPWAICPPLDSANAKTMLEVRFMRTILQRIKEEAQATHQADPSSKHRLPISKEAPNPETAQVIFFHVGALPRLNKFTFLRERLRSSDYVRFYTFGTHPSVSPNLWGAKEIFPVGGVVTFLPSCLMRQPYEVMQLIRKIEEHPFWTAYILPFVLGMIVDIARTNMPGEQGEFMYSYLLKAIETGQLALIEAPPDSKLCYGEPVSDRRLRWFQDYLSGLPPSGDDALALATAALHSKTANVSRAHWQSLIEREVAEDLARMQRQPAFISDYRRFVVLTGTTVNRQDSLEWVVAKDFSFNDAFFQD